MNLTIEQVQEKACEMFRTVTQILEEENFPYLGFYGTMLGTIRHGGPIPWDPDIDMAIPEPELERFVKLMETKLPKEYWIDFGDPKSPTRIIPRIGLAGYETRNLHIDVFRMVGFPDKHWRQMLFWKYSRSLSSLRCAKVYTYTGKKKLQADVVKALTCMVSAERVAKHFDRLCRKYPFETAHTIGNSTDHNGDNRLYTKDIFDSELMPFRDFQIRIPKDHEALLKILYGDYRKLPPESVRNAAMQELYEVRELA